MNYLGSEQDLSTRSRHITVKDWGGKGVWVLGRRSCDRVQVSSKAAGLASQGCYTPLPWQFIGTTDNRVSAQNHISVSVCSNPRNGNLKLKGGGGSGLRDLKALLFPGEFT